MTEKVRIDVWSDIACPWCFIGKRHLERALVEAEVEVEVVWHAYELNPRVSREVSHRTYAERIARKYRCSMEDAQAMIDRMVSAGAEAGLDLRFDMVVPTNTFDGHRLVAWARMQGRQGAMKERLLKAYMTEGANLGDHAVLAQLASEVGLNQEATAELLAGDTFSQEVRSDEDSALQLGISGVPFFVVGGRIPLSGAQPPEVIADAIRTAADTADVDRV